MANILLRQLGLVGLGLRLVLGLGCSMSLASLCLFSATFVFLDTYSDIIFRRFNTMQREMTRWTHIKVGGYTCIVLGSHSACIDPEVK